MPDESKQPEKRTLGINGRLIPRGLTGHKALESLDREIADAVIDHVTQNDAPARILVVCALDSTCRTLIRTLKQRRHHPRSATTIAGAQEALAAEAFDVLLVEPELPDGDGLTLAASLNDRSASTRTIVLGASHSVELAVRAIQHGAVDFIESSADTKNFLDRVDAAVDKARAAQSRDQRIDRLKNICRELNVARHDISKQVDELCSELVAAYQEIVGQIGEVAMASEFRTLVRQELDVEDLLRTMLEYLLTKTGPTNAAVFLPDMDGRFGLGAYVNYDCPRETVSVLLDRLGDAACPQVADDADIISFDDAGAFAEWIDLDADFMADSQVIAMSCRHNEECMAVMVLFRSKNDPFTAELAMVLDTLREIFAEQLKTVVRVHHRAKPSWPNDADVDATDDYDLDEDYGLGFGGIAA